MRKFEMYKIVSILLCFVLLTGCTGTEREVEEQLGRLRAEAGDVVDSLIRHAKESNVWLEVTSVLLEPFAGLDMGGAAAQSVFLELEDYLFYIHGLSEDDLEALSVEDFLNVWDNIAQPWIDGVSNNYMDEDIEAHYRYILEKVGEDSRFRGEQHGDHIHVYIDMRYLEVQGDVGVFSLGGRVYELLLPGGIFLGVYRDSLDMEIESYNFFDNGLFIARFVTAQSRLSEYELEILDLIEELEVKRTQLILDNPEDLETLLWELDLKRPPNPIESKSVIREVNIEIRKFIDVDTGRLISMEYVYW